jgi:hypothetical protein
MNARNGLGLITGSNFFVPQVPVSGSMATFVRPGAIPVPVAMAANGEKPTRGLRRLGGLGQDSSLNLCTYIQPRAVPAGFRMRRPLPSMRRLI